MNLKRWLGCVAVLTCSAAPGKAQTYTPYTADASTLHLWHMDAVAVPVPDAGGATVPLAVLGGGAALGAAGLPGLGTALDTSDGGAYVAQGTGTDAFLAPATLANDASDNVSTTYADPATGAFTIEAVVCLEFVPTDNLAVRAAPMQFISAEQDGTGGGVRIFQFRLDPVGFNPGADGVTAPLATPAVEFISVLNGVSPENKVVLLPTTGANAPVQGGWYHVAVTYTGGAGVTGNLTFYWTRLDGSQSQAALLGTKTLANNMSTGAADFAIGNTGRDPSQNNFVGLIDEVRISSVARAANAMLPATVSNANRPAAPAGLTAAATVSQVGLSWSAVTAATSYNLKRAFVSGGPYTTIASLAGTAFTDTNLANGTTYDYVVSAVTTSGESLNSREASATPAVTASLVDSDGVGLPDEWEIRYFGHLGVDPNADPDGDGFTNLEEYLAGTNPLDAGSTPPGPQTQYTPVDDGNAATSEYGYAGDSGINGIAFICNGLRTVGNQQFMTYYGRDQSNASYAFNNTLWVARRTLGSPLWEVFRTAFIANDITDGHDVIAFGIDGEGYMHLSWGMHNASGTAFHYVKSTAPVTGTNPISFGADAHNMTGNEVEVTYPQFLTLPSGDLLYLYRVGGSGGGSGNGNTFLNHYSLTTHAWANVNTKSSTVVPLIDGISYSYNAYPNMPCMDALGNLFLTWTWRYTANWQTNENFAFAKSTNAGVTWQRTTGTAYTLPLAEKYVSGTTPSKNCVAEQIVTLAQQSSLINQAGLGLDDLSQPFIASWWAPGTAGANYRRQYMVAFPTTPGTAWTTRQVSNRTVDATSFKDTTGDYVRDLGRPVALCDKQGRLVVLYRDNHVPLKIGGSGGGLTVAYCGTRAADPTRANWTTLELSASNLGGYEPVVDLARWQSSNVLDILYEPSQYTAYSGLAYLPPANTASPVGVFEWNEAAYFSPPPLHVTLGSVDAQLLWNMIPGYSYRLWYSADLSTWTALCASSSSDTSLDRTVPSAFRYTHGGGASGRKGFWRLEVQEGAF